MSFDILGMMEEEEDPKLAVHDQEPLSLSALFNSADFDQAANQVPAPPSATPAPEAHPPLDTMVSVPAAGRVHRLLCLLLHRCTHPMNARAAAWSTLEVLL